MPGNIISLRKSKSIIYNRIPFSRIECPSANPGKYSCNVGRMPERAGRDGHCTHHYPRLKDSEIGPPLSRRNICVAFVIEFADLFLFIGGFWSGGWASE